MCSFCFFNFLNINKCHGYVRVYCQESTCENIKLECFTKKNFFISVSPIKTYHRINVVPINISYNIFLIIITNKYFSKF